VVEEAVAEAKAEVVVAALEEAAGVEEAEAVAEAAEAAADRRGSP
jgi:hypothetical protein